MPTILRPTNSLNFTGLKVNSTCPLLLSSNNNEDFNQGVNYKNAKA